MPETPYHLFKSSRVYEGAPYEGPSLKTTGYEKAACHNMQEAWELRKILNRVNPVGWEIYHQGRNVTSLAIKINTPKEPQND